MEGTSSETIESSVEMKETENVETNLEVENDESENQQQRQDFTSESYKIELNNMGKFSFGVRIFIKLLLIRNFHDFLPM